MRKKIVVSPSQNSRTNKIHSYDVAVFHIAEPFTNWIHFVFSSFSSCFLFCILCLLFHLSSFLFLFLSLPLSLAHSYTPKLTLLLCFIHALSSITLEISILPLILCLRRMATMYIWIGEFQCMAFLWKYTLSMGIHRASATCCTEQTELIHVNNNNMEENTI